MILKVIIFLLANFLALLLGSFFTRDGVSSNWYLSLNKAPWTPPGWVFGAAWTLIMICFAFYMAKAIDLIESSRMVLFFYIFQWILNVLWNPTFFYFHNTGIALVVIVALTMLIGTMLFLYYPVLKLKSAFILPYFVWLLIATSLNGYIVFKNP